MRIIVWGTGHIANEYMVRKCYHNNDEIIAFVDNNTNLWGKQFRNINIVSPDDLERLKFDRLIICTVYYDEIKEQIKRELHIDYKKIKTYFELENEIKRKLIEKYKSSSDKDIQRILNYYSSSNSLNIYGDYEENEIRYPVAFESDGMPYIVFEGKKMFFPKEYNFAKIDNSEFVINLLYEQGEHSPHRYVKANNIIKKDMVIVDAGVCEGNFALRYVEDAKKIYLIESNPIWVEVLKRTFQPYKDKVIICDKYLSGKDSENTITLDTLISEKIDFIKMDIEGYEISALMGGKRVLEESDAYCAICSYHKHEDEENIKTLLKEYGYQTDTSEGYMLFVYDSYLEFRKGIVYGEKKMTGDKLDEDNSIWDREYIQEI